MVTKLIGRKVPDYFTVEDIEGLILYFYLKGIDTYFDAETKSLVFAEISLCEVSGGGFSHHFSSSDFPFREGLK